MQIVLAVIARPGRGMVDAPGVLPAEFRRMRGVAGMGRPEADTSTYCRGLRVHYGPALKRLCRFQRGGQDMD